MAVVSWRVWISSEVSETSDIWKFLAVKGTDLDFREEIITNLSLLFLDIEEDISFWGFPGVGEVHSVGGCPGMGGIHSGKA